MKNVKEKIQLLVEDCESLEKGTKESARVLANYTTDIKKRMNYTQTISKFISKDVYFISDI